MNRNYYCKVNSQEEADELLDKLKSIGEPINKLNFISISWYKIGYDTGTWSLLTQSHISRIKNATEVPASELIDYVTGKKLDKDALLEEAKKRYPVGTEFKSTYQGDWAKVIDLDFKWVEQYKAIQNSNGGWVYQLGNWAEIVEESKVEVKEKIKSTITWKIGDYVVFVEDWNRSKKGNIDKIKKLGEGVTTLYLKKEGLAGSPLHNDCKLKVFPTLQEAQKFSDELLGKSKTGLRVEDLVEGEIYVNGPDNGTMWCYIIKYSKNSFKKAVGLYKTGVYSAEYCNYTGDYTEGWLLRLATPDEKKWLNTCIKQDKFIEQSELDKYDNEGNLMEKNEEYPEYVKLINTGGCIGEAPIINRIYKLVKDNRGNYQYEFLLDNVYKFGFDDRNGKFTKYFELSTREAYEAQFKKDEKFKDGDWLVYIKHCGLSPSLPIKIGDVRQMIRGSFGTLTIYGAEDLSQYFRKALPHEIPVKNTVTQKPYNPEESIKLDFEVKWKEPRYIGGVDPISAFSCEIFEQMKKQSPQSRKTPDLIDKSKVKVEIKRTKVKQIKL